MMKLLYKIYTLVRYWPRGKVRKVFKVRGDLPSAEGEPKHKKILFCPFAPHQLNIIRESIWAHACRIRGAEVKMISYDLYLPAVDFLTSGVKKDLNVSYRIVRALYKIINLPVIYLSEYFTPSTEFPETNELTKDSITNLKYKGIHIGDLVLASTIRYFYCPYPLWENLEFVVKAREYAITAMHLVDIYFKMIETEKPDKIVTSHGIYISWGTLFKVARSLNIPVDVYSGSYRKNAIRFYHNLPNAPFPDGEWNSFKDKKLTDEENREIDKYIPTRTTQSEDSIKLFKDEDVLPEDIRDFIQAGKKNTKKVFCLFANLSWDSFMFRNKALTFDNMVDWVNQTVDWFKSDGNLLIVKAHPAEAFFNVPKKYRLRNFISENLPENILFLDENARVRPADIYNYIDAGLVYISTVSIEMALKNIPVITAGVKGHYSNRGFTIDPETRNEYFKFIDNCIKGNLDFHPDIIAAKRYLYFRFFREALIIDSIDLESFKIKKFNFNSINDLIPGKSITLDIICNGILRDTKYIN